MQPAAFSIVNYIFDQVSFDMTKVISNEFSIDFDPSGEYDINEQMFLLSFLVNIYSGDSKDNQIVKLRCVGFFKMENVHTLDAIPEFFYRNAIAILFPYVRAYISLITTQANVNGIILPTYNLSSLEAGLRANTILKK